MNYPVRLRYDEESKSYAVWCPMLPGCWSQGDTEAEALENIRGAIEEQLAALAELHEATAAEERTVFVEAELKVA